MSTQEPEQPGYVFPDPHLTLAEAIAQHRAMIPGLIVGDDDESVSLFTGHDAVHVIFGCSVSLPDETRADLWTMLATNMSLKRYLAYLKNPAVKALFSSFTAWQLVVSARGLLDLPRLWWRARHMTRRWDFDSWPAHLNDSVQSIRASHNIEPIHAA